MLIARVRIIIMFQITFLARILKRCKLNNTCFSPKQISTRFLIHREDDKFSLLWNIHFPLHWDSCFITHTHTHIDAFEINNITRTVHLLSFWLHWDLPQTLDLFNAQQSDKSALTANNKSHLSVQRTGIHSWLEEGNRVNRRFCRSLLH
jgi:hypothetical protein